MQGGTEILETSDRREDSESQRGSDESALECFTLHGP